MATQQYPQEMEKRLANTRKKQQAQLHQNMPAKDVISSTRPDIISNLPNDILCHIISLLPLESAAKTRLLSTQWSGLWNTYTTLVLKHGSLENAAKETLSFLSKVNWLYPLRHPWKLEFHSYDGSVLFATAAANSKLLLAVDGDQDQDQSSRVFLDLELSSRYEFIQPNFLIKSLYLTSINRQFSEAVSSLVSSLPFLESMEIKGCESLSCLRIHGGTKLEHLAIMDCPQLGSLSVLAHGLKSFRYQGRCPDTCVIGMSDCKRMALDFRGGPGYDDFKRLSSHSLLLLYLKDAEYITLCQWTFEVMIKPRICSKEKILRFSELRELRWIDCSTEEDKIESLISFLQICPSLERLIITIDPTCYSLPRDRNGSSREPRNDKLLHHLKMVKMKGFEKQEDEILVANRILDILSNEPVIFTTT